MPSRKPVEDPKTEKPRPGLGFFNGAKETRTPDPLHAMQVLYQLSYGPICAAQKRARMTAYTSDLAPYRH